MRRLKLIVGWCLVMGITIMPLHAGSTLWEPTLSQIRAAVVIAELKARDQFLLKQFALQATILSETPLDCDLDWSQAGRRHMSLSREKITASNLLVVRIGELVDYIWLDPELIAKYTTPKKTFASDDDYRTEWIVANDISFSLTHPEPADTIVREEEERIPTLFLSDTEFTLKSPDFYAERLRFIVATFNSEGRIAERKFHSHELGLFPPHHRGRGYLPFDLEELLLFCSGRGFSFAELSPIALTVRKDGLWELRAKGYYPNFPFFPSTTDRSEWRYGEWRLIIEPETYLVREAYWNGKLIVRTEGRVGKTLPIAVRGSRSFEVGDSGSKRPLFRVTVTFEEFDLSFHEEWYRQVLSRIQLEDVDSASIADYRFTDDTPLRYTYRRNR